jgi:hypothetical protein
MPVFLWGLTLQWELDGQSSEFSQWITVTARCVIGAIAEPVVGNDETTKTVNAAKTAIRNEWAMVYLP